MTKQKLFSVLVYFSLIIEKNLCNPINVLPPHFITHPANFMSVHPAIVPLYSMQYPGTFTTQHRLASLSNLDEQLQQANSYQSSNTNSEISNSNPNIQTQNTNQNGSKENTSKNDEEDDDANKRDDEDTFWEAASSYGKNRWTNFKDGFTELLDVFRAAGRGFKSIFTASE